MQNKKLFVVLVGLVLLVGAAAFLGGRMLNQSVGPAGPGGPPGSNSNAFSVQLIPAEELPKTAPEATGPFVERKDDTIVVSSIPLGTGQGGVVEQSSEGGGEEEPSLTSKNVPDGPKVEVVVTGKTMIYRETIQPPSGQNETIQQTVVEGTLDDLNSDSMVRVWGRKSGDRVIAEVLFYSSPFVVQGP
jgi:hypothetical protein